MPATQSGEIAWFQPKENPKSSGTPGPRSGHTITCAKEKAYFFGGCGAEKNVCALQIRHAFQRSPHRRVTAAAAVTAPFGLHSTAVSLPSPSAHGNLYTCEPDLMIPLETPRAQEATIFNDVHVLHISESFRWEKLDPMGDVPPPRWRHTATLLPDNKSIFIFGGLCKVARTSSRKSKQEHASARTSSRTATRAHAHTHAHTHTRTPPQRILAPTLASGQALQRHAHVRRRQE